ncbi:hypothetical protein [Neptunicella sp. SCSIO 80796]|uniref:hypothetical protein n=1 Tax=Neptunicella plasticusilytica TaxID=3117012 RepID=UPI003A4D378E
MAASEFFPDIIVTETHPKVLYYALTGVKYNYSQNRSEMDLLLSTVTGSKVSTGNDHEWDAVISAYAAKQWLEKNWTLNLHSLNTEPTEQIIHPAIITYYAWPR